MYKTPFMPKNNRIMPNNDVFYDENVHVPDLSETVRLVTLKMYLLKVNDTFLPRWDVRGSCVRSFIILATGIRDNQDDKHGVRAFWTVRRRSKLSSACRIGEAIAGFPAFNICWSAENLVRKKTSSMKRKESWK